jgi:23S rRNA (guanine745-N1)-methyltransferase
VAITRSGPRDSTTLATWLRCPRCERDLDSAGPAAWSLSCSAGHTYDANKRGYLSLVDRRRGITGDTVEILAEREAFLARGHYSPVAQLIDEVMPSLDGSRVIDSGCGTGYYLAELLRRRPTWGALALDVSPDAVAVAVRTTGAVGVVTDVWQPLPVRSSRADVVLCVFAPRNPREFARVLAPGGRLVVVTPSERHLYELRAAGRMIGIQDDKLGHLDAALSAGFELAERRSLEYTIDLEEAEVRSLAGMGPSGHHARAAADGSAEALEGMGRREPGDTGSRHGAALAGVTVAVDASVYTVIG